MVSGQSLAAKILNEGKDIVSHGGHGSHGSVMKEKGLPAEASVQAGEAGIGKLLFLVLKPKKFSPT